MVLTFIVFSPSLQVVKLVNEVYHLYNKHQYPFVVLNICVDSGKLQVIFSNFSKGYNFIEK